MSEISEPRLSIEEVMERLSLSRAEMYRRVKDGKLKSEKIDHRISFLESDVAQYAGVLEDERKSLQDKVTHWLSVFAQRLGKYGYLGCLLVDEKPVAEQIAELGRRIMVECVLGDVQDLYMDPLHDGDRLLYKSVGNGIEPIQLTAALSNPLKGWFKSQVTFPETETTDICEAPGQQTYVEHPSQFRMAVVPTLLGEHIHIHFYADYEEISVSKLGYTFSQVEALQTMLHGRPGLVLITGGVDPAAEQDRLALAHELSEEGRLVVSLEHHVQYRSDSLVQLNIGQKDGVAFNALWQTVLNMRPDVIFFDECRDKDEAQALIEGVDSGAIVISKVRASSAVDALSRLIAFEVNRVNLAQALLGVIERLVLRSVPVEGRTMRPVTAIEARLLGVPEGAEIPVHTKDRSPSGFQERRAIFGIWPRDAALSHWIRTPDTPVPRQVDNSSQPLSLVQAVTQAARDGSVAFEDAEPYISVPE